MGRVFICNELSTFETSSQWSITFLKIISFGLFALPMLVSNPVSAQDYSAEAKFQTPFGKGEQVVTVKRAIDGDSLELSNGERVRLIGIDTPESRYNTKLYRDAERQRKSTAELLAMGKRAALFTSQLVEGKRVRLEFDVQQKDRYDRILAYVYLEDGTFVNAEIVRQGYAQIMTIPPNVKYQDLFLRLQKEARENGRGLWAREMKQKPT